MQISPSISPSVCWESSSFGVAFFPVLGNVRNVVINQYSLFFPLKLGLTFSVYTQNVFLLL